ncbi:MAG: hypothetical protein F7B20_05855 [Aeropyrum sp.]|nr:hypothetical protein [Aeropyrum sp.]MCE4616289.1 hypothetical protein [Aeropyrum sp.]
MGLAFDRTLDNRIGALDSSNRAVIFSDVLNAVDGFVAAVTASLVSGDERLLAVAQAELEYILYETAPLRDVEGSLEVLGDGGAGIYEVLVALGPEGLRELLLASVEALEGYGRPDESLLGRLASVYGWEVDPSSLEPRLSASCVILSVASSFLRELVRG